MQLILDNGVDEYILRPTADDADVLMKLLERSDHATFDLGRKVLMFGNLSLHSKKNLNGSASLRLGHPPGHPELSLNYPAQQPIVQSLVGVARRQQTAVTLH